MDTSRLALTSLERRIHLSMGKYDYRALEVDVHEFMTKLHVKLLGSRSVSTSHKLDRDETLHLCVHGSE